MSTRYDSTVPNDPVGNARPKLESTREDREVEDVLRWPRELREARDKRGREGRTRENKVGPRVGKRRADLRRVVNEREGKGRRKETSDGNLRVQRTRR